MGTLTKDTTRLCEEIQNLRSDRKELQKKIVEGTKARHEEVKETCAAFTDARMFKAGVAHQDREQFVENLKQAVAEQEKELRDDLAGARHSWSKLSRS